MSRRPDPRAVVQKLIEATNLLQKGLMELDLLLQATGGVPELVPTCDLVAAVKQYERWHNEYCESRRYSIGDPEQDERREREHHESVIEPLRALERALAARLDNVATQVGSSEACDHSE